MFLLSLSFLMMFCNISFVFIRARYKQSFGRMSELKSIDKWRPTPQPGPACPNHGYIILMIRSLLAVVLSVPCLKPPFIDIILPSLVYKNWHRCLVNTFTVCQTRGIRENTGSVPSFLILFEIKRK